MRKEMGQTKLVILSLIKPSTQFTDISVTAVCTAKGAQLLPNLSGSTRYSILGVEVEIVRN